MAWRSKRAYLCTKSARKSASVYLVWGCLHCAMRKNVGFWHGAPSAHTSVPNLPLITSAGPSPFLLCLNEQKKVSNGLFQRSPSYLPNRHPKPLLLADLVHRYAPLGRHAKNPRFLALCISNTPILGIQKHLGGQMWCRGTRAWSATAKPHVFWHCAFQTPPS